MAQDLRSRTALIAVLLVGACGQSSPSSPRAVATAALAESEVLEAVLSECHGPLRGQMTRVGATITFADGSEVQLFAELPIHLRTQERDGSFLLRPDTTLRLDGDPRPATAAERRRLTALRALLDAAAFGPLHRGRDCRRTGDDSFVCADTDDAPVAFTLRSGTLLPSSFRIGGDLVTIHDYLRTPTTWIASELEVPALGRCRVRFDSRRVDWKPDFFQAPRAATVDSVAVEAAKGPRIASGASGEPRSPTPLVGTTAALAWAIVPDPGEWQARALAYAPLHAELTRQAQASAGFPVLFTENGKRWLAAPFRQRPDGPAFVTPAGWQVRRWPAGRWLYVYPPHGDCDTRAADGERQLLAALAAEGHQATSPITTQPFVHLQEGAPDAAKLLAPTVRVAVRID